MSLLLTPPPVSLVAALEYGDLLHQYETASTQTGQHSFGGGDVDEEAEEDEERIKDHAAMGEIMGTGDAFRVAAGRPPQTKQQLINSMTALKMRSKALMKLLHGDNCLEMISEQLDLAG